MAEPYVLGVDIGGTKIAGAFVSASGALRHRWEEATVTTSGDACLMQVRRLIGHAMVEIAAVAGMRVTGIGIGIPGAVQRDGTVWAPNIPGWEALPLAEIVRAEWHTAVAVECDRNTFVLAEHWLGAGRTCMNLAVVILGTGIGAGLMVDGHLCRGYGGVAGSIGWWTIEPQRLEREEYRRWGCLEALAAGPAIARRATRALSADGRAAFATGHAQDILTAQAVACAARDGDATAQRLFKQTAQWLGIALAGLVSLINPERILLAGGLAAASDLLLPEIEAAIKEYAQPLAARQVTLGVASLGRDAGILGAAGLLLASHKHDGLVEPGKA
jgi:glucokinase